MALLGLEMGDPLPSGGYSFVVTVQSGSGSADTWTRIFGPVFSERCGISLYPGSLSLGAGGNVSWDQPRQISAEGNTAEFCPLIIEETAVGVAFRLNQETRRDLETMSAVDLVNQLKLRDGQRIAVRLLPGNALSRCLTSA